MTPRLGFFTLLSIALAVLCFYLSERPSGGVDLVVLVTLALTLELTAVRTPCFGFLSTAFAAYLATALTQGAAAATALVVVGVGGRALGRGGPRAGAIWRESVADIFPALAALAVVTLMTLTSLTGWAGVGAGLVYLGATRLVPSLLAIEDEEFDLKELAAYGPVRLQLALGAVVTGVALALFLGGALVDFLWTLPLFSVFHFVAAQALQVRETRRMAMIEREQREDKRKLEQVKAKLEENQDALAHKVEERVLMEELSHLFARSLEVQGVLNTTVEMVRRTLGCQTVAIFLNQGLGPVPVCYHSPREDRLRDYSLLKLSEPVVDECWQRGLIIEGQAKHLLRPRLLEGEAWAVALPIYQQGVLYLGDRRPLQVTKQQRHLLAIIADQASVALQAARNYQELQDALELHASANQELAAWNQRLDLLLNGSRALGSTLRRDDVLERLQLLIDETLVHEAGAILEPDGRPTRIWPGQEGWNPEAIAQLCQAVSQSQRPLLFENVGDSRFGAPYRDYASLLIVPMVLEDSVVGALLVVHSQPSAFDQAGLDMLYLTAVHAAVVLRNCQLYQDVLEARRQIQESQAQVIQSSKLAAVGQLAAGIAHELNSPLAAVMLQLQMARRSLDKEKFEKVPKRLATAEQAAQNAKEIIAKLLYYSREAGPGKKPVDVNEVVRDTLELLGGQIRQEGVEVRDQLETVPHVLANKNELQQVITNLVLNARDAVMAGGGLIEIRTGQRQGRVLLQVRDSGPGIAPEVQARIFEPFFTTKEVGKGTGLGLSVTHQLVSGHQGELSVESVPGQGATFTVALPVLAES